MVGFLIHSARGTAEVAWAEVAWAEVAWAEVAWAEAELGHFHVQVSVSSSSSSSFLLPTNTDTEHARCLSFPSLLLLFISTQYLQVLQFGVLQPEQLQLFGILVFLAGCFSNSGNQSILLQYNIILTGHYDPKNNHNDRKVYTETSLINRVVEND